MKRQFLLPDPGEGLLEAEIVAWRVTEGQSIEVNDVLVEIAGLAAQGVREVTLLGQNVNAYRGALGDAFDVASAGAADRAGAGQAPLTVRAVLEAMIMAHQILRRISL